MNVFHTLPHYGNTLPNILNRSKLLRQLFQYSVICHVFKSIRLVLRDFDKNKISYRKCMWLQLRQVYKNSPKETRENLLSVLLFVLMLTS